MMRTFFSAVGLAAGVSAAIIPREQCCFQLTAAGGKSGTVGQLDDGQNRIGGGNPAGTYCLNNGGITDSHGRGCILTPPSTQFQCDTGASPTTGFSVNGSGQVQYNGNTKFYVCEAAPDQYNIYTTPVEGQKNCAEVTLSTGGKCSASGGGTSPSSPVPSAPIYSAPSSSASQPSQQPIPSTPSYNQPSVHSGNTPIETKPTAKSTVYSTVISTSSVPAMSTPEHAAPSYETTSPSQPASPASGSVCPTSLTGAYQIPHLIVPVSSSQPGTSYGTQYNASINTNECTIFNFDIPQSYSGKSCSVVFLFPEQSQLQTSSFTFSGTGNLVFSELSGIANQQTTWNNAPSKKSELGSIAAQPGHSYAISTQSCAAGTAKSIEVCATDSLSLQFFEDWNPSPIGVFITSC